MKVQIGCWLVLVMLLIAHTAVAQMRPMPVSGDEGSRLLSEGRSLMLDFRLSEAEARFRAMVTREDDRAVGYYYLSSIALWKALLNERAEDLNQFFAYSDSLVNVLNDDPVSPWRNHFFGEAHFHQAFAHARQGHYRRAILAARRAYQYFDRNARTYPDFPESYRSMGAFKVMMGSLPAGYRWLLSLLGYGSSVQDGFADLERAAAQSHYGREEAIMLLAVTDIILNESRLNGLGRLGALHEQYPNSPIFAHLFAFGLLSHQHAGEAEEVIRMAVDLRDDSRYYFVVQNYYYLADALFRQNRFAEAVEYFSAYVNEFQGKALMSPAHLKIGLSLEMLDRYQEALPYYERVEGSRDFDTDQYAKRMASGRIERPMTQVERQMVLGMNAQDGGRCKEAVSVLSPVYRNSAAPTVLRAEAAYRMGRCMQREEKWEEAIGYFRFASENPGDRTAKWGPWSQYYIGEIFEERGDRERAREEYDAVSSFRGQYDYSRALEQKIRTARNRL